MKLKTIYISLLAGLLIVPTGCRDEESETDFKDPLQINSWIHKEMKSNYLWLDEIGELKEYKGNDTPDNFFNSLISKNEKKDRSGQTYWYSFIEKKHDATKVSEYAEDTYGMEYVFYSIKGKSYYFARVLYVLPDSPAQKAGVKRGMWIKQLNGQPITQSNRDLLAKSNGITLGIYEGAYNSNDELTKEIRLESQKSMFENPFLKDTVFVANTGVRIGYLVYNHFSTGPTGFEDKAYDEQMASIFNDFKNGGVSEFILDLRYNPGGFLDCAVSLGSYLVPAESLNKVFCEVSYNPKSNLRSKVYNFKQGIQSNLNLNRVYILTGEWTASASEAVINGLKPLMDVVQVGDTTEGKNLGSIAIENDNYEWILHPIVAKIANSVGSGDYWTGIVPTVDCVFQELRDGSPLGELGTLDDRLIQIALNHMGLLDEKKIAPSRTSVRGADSNLQPHSTSLSRKSMPAIRIN